MTILTPARPLRRAGPDHRSFLLQRAQPAMNGLIDGSLSTLAPIFAVAFATHQPHYAFLAGLATALGAGISRAFLWPVLAGQHEHRKLALTPARLS